MREKGAGNIRQRKNGSWQASVQVNGKRRWVYGRTREQAEAKLAQLLAKIRQEKQKEQPAERVLNDLLDAWLEVHLPKVRPGTAQDYQQTIACYIQPRLGSLPLMSVNAEVLEKHYAGLQQEGLQRAAQKVHQRLSQAFKLAVRWGWVPTSPCALLDTPRYRPQQKRMWTREELLTFIEGTKHHWLGALWLFLLSSGCRLGEALALEWTDVDWKNGRVTIDKGAVRLTGKTVTCTPKTPSGTRVIALDEHVMQALRAQQATTAPIGSRLVFVGERSHTSLDGSYVSHATGRLCEQLGIPKVSPHEMRHTHASILLQHGIDIPQVARRLGHADSSTTLRIYAHVLEDDQAAAVKAIEDVLRR